MDESGSSPSDIIPTGLDETNEEEYASLSKLLQEFTNISTIDTAWTFTSDNAGKGTRVMFSTAQPDLLANKMRRCILTSHISEQSESSVIFNWAPFPLELTGVPAFVPSPSGSKLLIIRNSENESPTKFEIWVASQVEKEFQIPNSIHGTVYQDGWFEGISWNYDETLIAYVAEEPAPSNPTFDSFGHKKGDTKDKGIGTWKGQGDWEEDWGETYTGKRRSTLFVININSGVVRPVEGIGKTLTAGQVVWAPPSEGSDQRLVFVGWSGRKFGVKYCQSRPCAVYTVRSPFHESDACEPHPKVKASENVSVLNLTESISSALFPCFSPDGKFIVFLSAKSAVDSGAHLATNSLYRIEWPTDGKLEISPKLIEVVPVVMCAENGCFPGLYCSSILCKPWLSDSCTMVVTCVWGSTRVILSINVFNGHIERISPTNLNFSWNVLAIDGDNIIAVSSSPVDVPVIKYGTRVKEPTKERAWRWLDVSNPISRCSEKVTAMLSSLQFSVMKIPTKDGLRTLHGGASKPFEAIFVSSRSQRSGRGDPLIVFLHGGPHDVSVTKFSKSLAFLSSLGYSLLIVNYRGSLGFGEEALQSLPGKVGTQDVNDVLTAIDHVIDMGLADPSKITVMGGSHGGFLSTHLIGQAPGKFVAAVAQNPVCNLSLMVGTTDIPDWCYVEAFGTDSKTIFKEAPLSEHLALFHNKSPVSRLDKVKTPTLFLFGNKDRRVPVSTGLQYARALKEQGVEVKVMMFPNDVHEMDIPRTEFESYLNIGVWFNRYCK